MKTKEFDLSEKITKLFEIEYLDSMADVQGDVSKILKEFIKRVKELMDDCCDSSLDQDIIFDNFNKLVGEKLI